MTAQYGLIGFPLAHSFSPGYFNKKFEQEGIDAAYETFPIERIEDWPSLLKERPLLKGVNVTIPYKTSIIPFLDGLTPEAKKTGAVNCVLISNGKTFGHNTDALGFEQSLKPLLKPQHKKALILGTGGSSRAVGHVLEKLGIATKKVSRTAKDNVISYRDIDEQTLRQYPLIVNTTPLGMSPDTQAAPPIPYHFINERHLLFDLIYNPGETRFLSLGKAQGAAIKNGLEMLYLQAEAGWKFWNS